MDTPVIRNLGYDGMLVTFGDTLNDAANRAALAFHKAVSDAQLDGVTEASTSLVSAYVRFDPLVVPHAQMKKALSTILATRDWYAAPPPEGRNLWRIPAVFGGELGPQLAEASALAGMTETEAIAALTHQPVRVQTIGFAPGMPYLGELPENWDIPRQSKLTAEVPQGGLCVAIRQLVLFPNRTPTGWRHIAQTRVRLFQPDADMPFLLKPGDEVIFDPVSTAELAALADNPKGGAVQEALP
ncbi:MAG: allophanate hydrolase subunit 1 [Dinoroseobacter sp.]|nr:allophanate hydrolase subunit 1 [Dinoroseobacter sp.]